MPSDCPFEEGKIVAVLGGTIDNTGEFSESVNLCTVIAVGERDLLVRSVRGHFRDDEVSKVSKDVCVPVSINHKKLLDTRLLEPKMGDLVLSYEKKKWSDKSFTSLVGILCEISYDTGNAKSVKILCNGEFVSVGYNSLIVLQKSK
tara:strand:- start:370 stop:807 length:438 start_codon:yes stop_codon:yes gene_type:complete